MKKQFKEFIKQKPKFFNTKVITCPDIQNDIEFPVFCEYNRCEFFSGDKCMKKLKSNLEN